mmetsp:Transcript_37536/g.69929  ORF Transcript_37536/g.69929 Transcript_37536/m.69929 type:complete len:243 (-) Transcript_37536:1192-1920(-)
MLSFPTAPLTPFSSRTTQLPKSIATITCFIFCSWSLVMAMMRSEARLRSSVKISSRRLRSLVSLTPRPISVRCSSAWRSSSSTSSSASFWCLRRSSNWRCRSYFFCSCFDMTSARRSGAGGSRRFPGTSFCLPCWLSLEYFPLPPAKGWSLEYSGRNLPSGVSGRAEMVCGRVLSFFFGVPSMRATMSSSSTSTSSSSSNKASSLGTGAFLSAFPFGFKSSGKGVFLRIRPELDPDLFRGCR